MYLVKIKLKMLAVLDSLSWIIWKIKCVFPGQQMISCGWCLNSQKQLYYFLPFPFWVASLNFKSKRFRHFHVYITAGEVQQTCSHILQLLQPRTVPMCLLELRLVPRALGSGLGTHIAPAPVFGRSALVILSPLRSPPLVNVCSHKLVWVSWFPSLPPILLIPAALEKVLDQILLQEHTLSFYIPFQHIRYFLWWSGCLRMKSYLVDDLKMVWNAWVWFLPYCFHRSLQKLPDITIRCHVNCSQPQTTFVLYF